MITDVNLDEAKQWFFEREKRYAVEDKCSRMEKVALELIEKEQQRRNNGGLTLTVKLDQKQEDYIKHLIEEAKAAQQPPSEEVQTIIDDLDCLVSEITINTHIPVAYRTVVNNAITALRAYNKKSKFCPRCDARVMNEEDCPECGCDLKEPPKDPLMHIQH